MRTSTINEKKLLMLLKEGQAVSDIADILQTSKTNIYYNMQANRLAIHKEVCSELWSYNDCKKGIATKELKECIKGLTEEQKLALIDGATNKTMSLRRAAQLNGVDFLTAGAYISFLCCLCPVPRPHNARNERIAMWLNAEKIELKDFAKMTSIPLPTLKYLINDKAPSRLLSTPSVATLMSVTGLSYDEVVSQEKAFAESVAKNMGWAN